MARRLIGAIAAMLCDPARKAGLDQTRSNAVAAVLGSVTEQCTAKLDRTFPGLSEEMAEAERTASDSGHLPALCGANRLAG
jgi:hypothetical protein